VTFNVTAPAGAEDTFVYSGGFPKFDGGTGSDTVDFSNFGSAVWADLAYAGPGVEAWTKDGPNLSSGMWREIADFVSIENIVGTSNADDIRGDGNANRLEGGAGDDILTGRAGADTFVFKPGFGRDTITDFAGGSGGGDVIEFDHNIFADFAAVLAATQQAGADSVITVGPLNTVTLKNVALASLHINDFQFV
jgi:Ca2+-binding RTX toxin-like protein